MQAAKIAKFWLNLHTLENDFRSVHVHLDYGYISKLCQMDLIFGCTTVIISLLFSAWHPQNMKIGNMFNTYIQITQTVTHASWFVSFATIAHMFRQLKDRCWYIHLRQFPLKVKTDNLKRLRKAHYRSCELLRHLNDAYFYHLLIAFGMFFINLTLVGFNIIKQAIDANVSFFEAAQFFFIIFGNAVTIYVIQNSTTQVRHILLTMGVLKSELNLLNCSLPCDEP